MHIRAPKTTSINLPKVKTDPTFIYDARLVSTYKNLYEGKIKVSLTRIRTDDIETGHALRDRHGNICHISNLKIDNAELVERIIRTGRRPVLDLYWNPHVRPEGGYVCADDEASLEAYRRLNIKLAPCRILRPKDFPSYEAAIWLEKRGNRVGLAKAVAPNITGYLSIVGEMDISLSTLGKKLIKLCSEARSNIVSFHLQDDNPIHYHHMLFALLRRHEEFINSIIFLMGLGRTDHAFAVMRMAYEAFLNFYLDWLSPQFIGPRLQLLSALRHQEANGEAVEDKNWSILANFPELLENAADKARLSPLGKSYHDNLYPMLSLVAHQSYFNIEKEALTFDSDNLTNITDEKFLVCRLDFLTCALIRLIRNDVGQEIID